MYTLIPPHSIHLIMYSTTDI